MIPINNEILDIQSSCTEINKSSCKMCCFFLNCNRRYLLRASKNELYIIVSDAIILFPSEEMYLTFCQENNYGEDLLQGLYDDILNLSENLNIEIIIYN
jgi:hypothetical protein